MLKGKKKKKVFKVIAVILLISIGFLVIQNEVEAKRRNHVLDSKTLSAADKKEIEEVVKIKKEFGNEIWPAFKEKEIPIILFNDKYEFLYADMGPDNCLSYQLSFILIN